MCYSPVASKSQNTVAIKIKHGGRRDDYGEKHHDHTIGENAVQSELLLLPGVSDPLHDFYLIQTTNLCIVSRSTSTNIYTYI